MYPRAVSGSRNEPVRKMYIMDELVKNAIEKYPEKLAEYKAGRKGILGLFVGEVMKMSNGTADPKETVNKVREYLDSPIV